MDFPTALLRNLLQLSRSIGLPEDTLSGPLAALVDDVRAAVPSYRGLRLTIVDNGHPVSLTVFLAPDGRPVTTSLRMSFAALGPGFPVGSGVVFYAAAPGSLVDLAADLGYALGIANRKDGFSAAGITGSGIDGHDGPVGRDGHAHLLLDADLPPPTLASGLTGLDELSAINRAVGVLIDRGHNPDDAHAMLHRQAAAAGVAPHVYAAQLPQR